MTWRPGLHAQAKRKKKEEAANAKILEAEKRTKVGFWWAVKTWGNDLTTERYERELIPT